MHHIGHFDVPSVIYVTKKFIFNACLGKVGKCIIINGNPIHIFEGFNPIQLWHSEEGHSRMIIGSS